MDYNAFADNYLGVSGGAASTGEVQNRPITVGIPTNVNPSSPYNGEFSPPDLWLQGTGGYNPNPMTQADLVRNDLITDPSYQFRFNQGLQAIQNRGAALGKRFSGNMLQALTDYGQDYASQEFGNAYNRLAGISGTGQTATNALNQASQNYANAVGNAQGQIGSANANAALASGQAQAGMWNTIGQAAGNIFAGGQDRGWW